MVGICVEMCSSDQDCGSGERCCSNGCGHTCQRVAQSQTGGVGGDVGGGGRRAVCSRVWSHLSAGVWRCSTLIRTVGAGRGAALVGVVTPVSGWLSLRQVGNRG